MCNCRCGELLCHEKNRCGHFNLSVILIVLYFTFLQFVFKFYVLFITISDSLALFLCRVKGKYLVRENITLLLAEIWEATWFLETKMNSVFTYISCIWIGSLVLWLKKTSNVLNGFNTEIYLERKSKIYIMSLRLFFFQIKPHMGFWWCDWQINNLPIMPKHKMNLLLIGFNPYVHIKISLFLKQGLEPHENMTALLDSIAEVR